MIIGRDVIFNRSDIKCLPDTNGLRVVTFKEYGRIPTVACLNESGLPTESGLPDSVGEIPTQSGSTDSVGPNRLSRDFCILE